MDWVPALGVLTSGCFFIPIINDYQKRRESLDRQVHDAELRIAAIEESTRKASEEEDTVKGELEEAKKELTDKQKQKEDLQKAVAEKEEERGYRI